MIIYSCPLRLKAIVENLTAR